MDLLINSCVHGLLFQFGHAGVEMTQHSLCVYGGHSLEEETDVNKQLWHSVMHMVPRELKEIDLETFYKLSAYNNLIVGGD